MVAGLGERGQSIIMIDFLVSRRIYKLTMTGIELIDCWFALEARNVVGILPHHVT